MTKIAGSGSGSEYINQRNGYPDPDPHQNVMDPEHCRGAKYLKLSLSHPDDGCLILTGAAGPLRVAQDVLERLLLHTVPHCTCLN
jgi:hypothetical protein